MNEEDAFLDSIVSDWELEEQQLERSHSSYATWCPATIKVLSVRITDPYVFRRVANPTNTPG